jgi:hypothetical protein
MTAVRRSILEVIFPVSTPTTDSNETIAGPEEEGILDDDENKAKRTSVAAVGSITR